MNNRIKQFLEFILIISLAISCVRPPRPDINTYFPLEIGNKWYYYSYNLNSFDSDSIYVSCDSIVIRDNVEYYVLNSKEPWQDFLTAQRLFREDNGKVYRYINGQEYLYLNFEYNYNDPWVLLPYTRTCEIISKTDTFRFNNNEVFDLSCIHMHEDSPLDSSIYVYAKNIGLIHTTLIFKNGAVLGSPIELIWAKIKNTKYIFK